ncbi:licodione synthase-like [Abrus precatorius]|uniref:Licodione synthase-like n=1 Tax=Abrus precatorius TaxID=3816 RepID=A0A8B8KNK7_ABRPR|nr:licodione synthase-like [Abrus precatorius]
MDLQLLLGTFFLSALLLYFFFHRHSHHLPPSPLLWVPVIGHMHLLGPLLHHSLHRLSLRYGPLFSLRLGSVPCVVVSSPHFAKQFLQTNELAFSCRLESTAIKRLTYECSLAFAPYGDYWRFIKKLSMNELLGSRSVNNFQHLRAHETRRFLKLLSQKAKACEAVNVTDEMLKLTNNVISRMILGEAEEARDVVRGVTKIFGEFNVSDFIWLFKSFDFQGFGERIEDLFRRFDSLVEKVISKREEMRKNKAIENGESWRGEGEIKDFLNILLDYVDDESSEVKINRVHIKALIMDFFTAGTDTTATSTEWALVELIKNPSLLQQAREEIDKVVGKSRLVEESDFPNLPYLQAIVKETYRLHPPVPLVTRRCVTECKIENYVIPKDTLLAVNVWSIGRNSNYWDNPLEFCPERFLNIGEGDSKGLIDVRGQHFQLLPFGSGRRMCPGVNLAMQLVPALLGAIIQCFDFQVMESKGVVLNDDNMVIDMDERPGLTAPRAHDLVCVPVERERFNYKPL